MTPHDAETRPSVVIGAGTLGRGIALVQATCGSEVRLVDTSAQALRDASAYLRSELPKLLPRENGKEAKLVFTQDLSGALENAWLVTEAVPEQLELKKRVFSELDRLADPDTILASNSSSFPTSQMIDRVVRKQRVVNTHYYW